MPIKEKAFIPHMNDFATKMAAQRIMTKNSIDLKAMVLKITALKAITNNNMTAEEGFGIINDFWDDLEKYDS